MSVPLPGTGIFCNPKAVRLAHGFLIIKKAPFVSETELQIGWLRLFSAYRSAAAHNVCAADDAPFRRSVRRYIRRRAS